MQNLWYPKEQKSVPLPDKNLSNGTLEALAEWNKRTIKMLILKL
ncbi:unknow (plasmid) [Vibrio campbellii]|uniref:Uncharacterized protein n=1 Tax=Vibrio parahaemolyticus TaxID=670 RepID=A0A077EML4_VIBPH|nr:hypothetical protein [Vibrio parahaemolyticus]ARR10051.1 unknow [Vibrio campbellii]